jgi:hypothetical protein
MAFTGNLNAVALTDIVQLVGLARRSGTLTVVTGRGRFTVLFRDGYVVDASAVRFPSPGADGGPRGRELHLRANLSGDPSRGMSLEEMAGKIFRLGAGYFNFQAGEPETDSATALDVSGLLLESFRQHDEAVHEGTAATNDYESNPDEMAGAEGVLGADVTAPPTKPNALRHLHALFKAQPEEPGGHDHVRVLLEAARQVFDRAILFEVSAEELRGVAGYSVGYAGHAGRLDAALAAVRIPRGVNSPLQDVVEAKHIGIGEAPPEWWESYMPGEFGPRPEMEYVALPVVADDDCVMVLYGDAYAHREFADPLRALEIVCKHVGVLVENERLRGRRQDPRKSWRARLFGGRDAD